MFVCAMFFYVFYIYMQYTTSDKFSLAIASQYDMKR